jgi:hypothetical protein
MASFMRDTAIVVVLTATSGAGTFQVAHGHQLLGHVMVASAVVVGYFLGRQLRNTVR